MQRRVVIGQYSGKLAEPRHGRLKNSVLRIKLRLLRNDADAQTRLPPDTSVIRERAAGQQFEQAGFSGAIATNQSDAAARFQHQIDMVKQRHMAVSERYVFECCYWQGLFLNRSVPDRGRITRSKTQRNTRQFTMIIGYKGVRKLAMAGLGRVCHPTRILTCFGPASAFAPRNRIPDSARGQHHPAAGKRVSAVARSAAHLQTACRRSSARP